MPYFLILSSFWFQYLSTQPRYEGGSCSKTFVGLKSYQAITSLFSRFVGDWYKFALDFLSSANRQFNGLYGEGCSTRPPLDLLRSRKLNSWDEIFTDKLAYI